MGGGCFARLSSAAAWEGEEEEKGGGGGGGVSRSSSLFFGRGKGGEGEIRPDRPHMLGFPLFPFYTEKSGRKFFLRVLRCTRIRTRSLFYCTVHLRDLILRL